MTDDYMKRAGLTEDQIKAIREGLRRESRYRELLLRHGVFYKVACLEADRADPDKIDLSNEELLNEKIKLEYKDYIIKRKGE